MNATSPDQWLVTGPGKIQWSVIWVQHLVRTNSYICEGYSFLGPLLWCCGLYEEKRPPQDPDCTLALQHVGYFTRPKYPQCECKWIFLMIILWCGIPGPLIRVLYVNTTLRARICVIGIGSGQCFWSMQFVHARRHLHPEHYCLYKGSTPHVWSMIDYYEHAYLHMTFVLWICVLMDIQLVSWPTSLRWGYIVLLINRSAVALVRDVET